MNEKESIAFGIKCANRPRPVMPSSVLSSNSSMHLGFLLLLFVQLQQLFILPFSIINVKAVKSLSLRDSRDCTNLSWVGSDTCIGWMAVGAKTHVLFPYHFQPLVLLVIFMEILNHFMTWRLLEKRFQIFDQANPTSFTCQDMKGMTFETVDPRTGEVIVRVSEGDKEDIDIAVRAAREAFDSGPWPRLSGAGRAKIMMKWAEVIDQNIEELAALEAIDAGKLYHLAKILDIPEAANTLRYYAGAADKIHGEVLKMSREFHAYTLMEPIGVVGHIIPWNAPTAMFFTKVSPSLAAGCTMVVKPAEQTPLSALFYAHLAKLAGIPDGVLNVVPGFGPTAGAAISSHMDIDAVSFTGSVEVGREVMEAAAKSNLKQVSLELGGKSPLIIFDDADIDKATDLALLGTLFNKGEVCVASSRVFVQEGIYDEFEKKLVEKAKTWVVGDPFDSKSQQGPQVDRNQFEKILSYIDNGKREGATLLTGGKAIGGKGYYIEPTIFSDVKEDMLIAQDEIFGPVTTLMKFKTVEEAIKSANNTKYGLAAGIVTKNLDTANTMSRSIRAGTIWINCYLALGNDLPFGGYKMSGFGRDLGLDALHKYLQVKSVVTPIYNSPWL